MSLNRDIRVQRAIARKYGIKALRKSSHWPKWNYRSSRRDARFLRRKK